MSMDLVTVASQAEPGPERSAVFRVPEEHRLSRKEAAEERLREEMNASALICASVDSLQAAVEEAQVAGASASVVFAARQQIRRLCAQEALDKAISRTDADALEACCSRAETCGVPQGSVIRARQRVQRLRAAAHLQQAATGRGVSDAEYLECAAREAEEAGVATSHPSRQAQTLALNISAVGDAFKESARLRAESRTRRALSRTDADEIESAARAMLAAETHPSAKLGLERLAAEAREKARRLRAEKALRLATDSGEQVHHRDLASRLAQGPRENNAWPSEIEKAAHVAEKAGVPAKLVSDARWRASRLRSHAQAHFIPDPCLSWVSRFDHSAHAPRVHSALHYERGHVHGETSTAGLSSGLPPMCPLSLSLRGMPAI